MHPVRLYTTPSCPFCVMAKRLLQSRDIPFENHDVSERAARAKIVGESGWPTVPVIYIGEELIGGFDELSDLDRSGRLEEMVKG